MSKLKSILRLYTQGHSKVGISKSLRVSRNTVKRYIRRFNELKISYDDLLNKQDKTLHELFQLPVEKELPERLQQLHRFFPYVEKEIKRPGVTRKLLWEEYIGKHPDGYASTQFNEYFNRWRGTTKPSMRVEHKAGDKLYIDYAGKKLGYIEQATGEVVEAEIFVSILGASQLIYVEASASQRKEDFITSVENALQFYGGVPKAIVPDNLKSAVKKSHRYEPDLNELFEDFAEHYDTVILPTRVYKPKDKALVEGAVKIVYTAIFTALRNNQYYSLAELNAAIHRELILLNNRPFSHRPVSRRDLFEELEQKLLKPLPNEKYQIKETALVTVMKTGHVCLQKDKHYYSVHYRFIGKKVKLVWSTDQVTVYYKFERIAVHKRSRSAYNYTTEEEHLASAHKFIAQWNPEYFRSWARNIDPYVEQVIIDILERKKYPEQAYRSCIGVLSLTKKVGKQRLIQACARALEYGACNYRSVLSILEKGLDQLDHEQPKSLPPHDNIRGEEYYT